MSTYGHYDYVQADIDLYNIPEKYHAIMRNIFSKNEAATFKYDKETDTCCYTNWPDMKPWYDVITGNIVSDFGNVGLFPNLYDDDVYGNNVVEWDDFSDKKQASLMPTKDKKKAKIDKPIEGLYNKVMPKKPMDLLVGQKG